MEKKDWLASRIAFIKGLKAPTESQRMLLELAALESPTKLESRQLDALVRLEKVNQRAEEAKAAAQKVMAERRDQQRKARTRELIELGGIVAMVDFPVDRGTLTGALLWVLDQFKTDKELAATLKKRGDTFIVQREKEKQSEPQDDAHAPRADENVAA
jgi:hypothetical protein